MAARIDPNSLESATWRFGPMFMSWEGQDGQLGVNYTTGVDTRYPGLALPGPAFVSIDCSSVAGTVANANSIAVIKEPSGSVMHVYVARGTKTADIIGSTLALSTKTLAAALAERCTGLLTTLSASAARELTEFMAATQYRVRTVIGAQATNTADTVANNASAQVIRIGGQADDRVAGFLGDVAFGNILTGTTTMVTPAWNTVGTYYGGGTTPTGFAMNLNTWTWCTDKGPLYLNALRNVFVQTFSSESITDLNNGRAVRTIPYIGTVVPEENSVRSYVGTDSQTVGPERWPGNESPIKGVLMGQDFSRRWAMWAYTNTVTGTTYFLAVRPRQNGDPHSNPLSFYCLGTTTNAVEVVKYLGTINGAQTQPIWMFGDGSNVTYFKAGLLDRWPDDTGYQYSQVSQTLFGTELRRYPDEDKTPVYVDIETAGTTATRTVGVYFTGVTENGNSYTTPTIVIRDPGRKRLSVPGTFSATGRRWAPNWVFTNDSATAPPKIIGDVKITFKRTGGH